MATSTSRLLLRKPDPTPVTGDLVTAALDLNANWDIVDAAVGAVACTSGTRPGSPFNGQLARETDTGNLIICTNTVGPVWSRIFMQGQARWDMEIQQSRSSASSLVQSARVVGSDTFDRWQLQADGKQFWGGGGGAVDTNLYRSAANELTTDDSLIVAGDFSAAGVANIPGLRMAYENKTSGNQTVSPSHVVTHSKSFTAVSGRTYVVTVEFGVAGSVAGSAVIFYMRHAAASAITTSSTVLTSRQWVVVTNNGRGGLNSISAEFVASASGTYAAGVTMNFYSGSGTMTYYSAANEESTIRITQV